MRLRNRDNFSIPILGSSHSSTSFLLIKKKTEPQENSKTNENNFGQMIEEKNNSNQISLIPLKNHYIFDNLSDYQVKVKPLKKEELQESIIYQNSIRKENFEIITKNWGKFNFAGKRDQTNYYYQEKTVEKKTEKKKETNNNKNKRKLGPMNEESSEEEELNNERMVETRKRPKIIEEEKEEEIQSPNNNNSQNIIMNDEDPPSKEKPKQVEKTPKKNAAKSTPKKPKTPKKIKTPKKSTPKKNKVNDGEEEDDNSGVSSTPKKKIQEDDLSLKIKELFKIRPIWSVVAMVTTNFLFFGVFSKQSILNQKKAINLI